MFLRTQGTDLYKNRKALAYLLAFGVLSATTTGNLLKAGSVPADVPQIPGIPGDVGPQADGWSTTLLLLLMLESLRQVLDEPEPGTGIFALNEPTDAEALEASAMEFIAAYQSGGVDGTIDPQEALDNMTTADDAQSLAGTDEIPDVSPAVLAQLTLVLEDVKADLAVVAGG